MWTDTEILKHYWIYIDGGVEVDRSRKCFLDVVRKIKQHPSSLETRITFKPTWSVVAPRYYTLG